MSKLFFIPLLLVGLLAACSSNPYAVEPNAVPSVKATINIDRIWRHRAGSGLDKGIGYQLRPAVSSGQVVAADVNGRISAYYLGNNEQHKPGKRHWRQKTGYQISAGLYAGHGRVLFGTHNGVAVALAADDGRQLWEQQLTSELLSVPVSNGKLAIFVSQDGEITALDMLTGAKRWSYSVTVPSLSLRGGTTPLVADGLLYVGLASGKVVALDISDGTLVWERQMAIPEGTSDLERLVDVSNNFFVEHGGLFSATYQGSVTAVDQQTGRVFWEQEASTYTPMAHNYNTLFIATSDGDLVALDQRGGQTVWTQDALHGRKLVGAVMQSGYVVVGDFEGWLYWLDSKDGKIVARYHAENAFAGPLVVSDKVLYTLGAKGRLSAFKVAKKK